MIKKNECFVHIIEIACPVRKMVKNILTQNMVFRLGTATMNFVGYGQQIEKRTVACERRGTCRVENMLNKAGESDTIKGLFGNGSAVCSLSPQVKTGRGK